MLGIAVLLFHSLFALQPGNIHPADELEQTCFRSFIESQYDSLNKYQKLLNEAAGQSNDKRLSALNKFYQIQSLSGDSTQFLKASQESLKLSQDAKCDECIALHYLSVGLAYRKWQQFSVAVENLKKGLAFVRDPKEQRTQTIYVSLTAALSNTYHQLGEFTTALEYGLDALRTADLLNDPALKIKVYTPLSTIYADLSSPNNNLGTEKDRDRYKTMAKHYMIGSYKLSVSTNNQRTSGTAAYNLGIFYNDKNQLDSSTWFLRKAIAHGQSVGNNELLANSYNIMAINYSDSKIDSSLLLIDKAIDFAKKGSLTRQQASAMLSKANLLAMSGKNQDAIKQAEEALKMCLLSERRLSILNAYKILSELNEEVGNSEKAYYYYRKHIALKDSLVNEENYANIEELKMKYDVELKDKEINNQTLKLRERNVLIASLAGFIILGGFVTWMFIRQRSLKQKQVVMETEQRLNRARMNPHFFFNALSSLQQYAIESKDSLVMASRLSQFSEVMRKTLESTYQEYITVEEEMEFLDRYLSIQKDRNASFNYKISIAPDADPEMLIPPMIIQPFVENSIEHGLSGLTQQGEIVINFSVVDDQLHVVLTDNGRGITTNKPNNEHISRATQIISDRLYLLNQKLKSNARFTIDKNPGGNGVMVSIILPKLFKDK